MSTLQLENIKNPDATGNALELAADGSLNVVSNIKNDAGWYAASIPEAYDPRIALVIEQTRGSVNTGMSFGAIGSAAHTSIQGFDTVTDGPNNISINPLGGDLAIGASGSGSNSVAYDNSVFQRIVWNGIEFQGEAEAEAGTTTAGPNKIELYKDPGPNWVAGFGISDNTLDYYSGGRHRFRRKHDAVGSGGMVRDHMLIDESGYVTMPRQPAFTAHGSVNTWHNSVGVIPFNATDLNNSNSYDAPASTFYAPVDGMYHFAWSFLIGADSNSGHISLRKNGVNLYEVAHSQPAGGAEYDYVGGGVNIYLNQNDYVDMRINSTFIGNGIYTGENNGYYSYWSGHLIG
jgi:hypothetical protein